MSPPTHPPGRSDMHITRLGFGSWAAGGRGWAFAWGPQDDEASPAAMRHAIEAGLIWIVEDAWAAMTKLIEKRQARAAGVSNVDIRLLDRCEAIPTLDEIAAAIEQPGAARSCAVRRAARVRGMKAGPTPPVQEMS